MASAAVLLVGVGGQGVLTAAEILAAAAHEDGLPVVVGQLHGMSQRGGSVECSVTIGGERQTSFLSGPAGVVVGFEPLETLRALPRMGEQTRVLLNRGRIVPFTLVREDRAYPPVAEIVARLRETAASVVEVEASALAAQAGDARTVNAVMLGALSGLAWLPLSAGAVEKALSRRGPKRLPEANLRAFALGRGGR